MASWLNQLFSYIDKSKDGKLQIEELIIANSPSVGIDYNECNEVCVSATMTQEKARSVGKNTTRIFLAMILHSVPTALNDGVLDLNELRTNASKTQDLKLYTDDDSSVPTTLGQQLLTQADTILANY